MGGLVGLLLIVLIMALGIGAQETFTEWLHWYRFRRNLARRRQAQGFGRFK